MSINIKSHSFISFVRNCSGSAKTDACYLSSNSIGVWLELGQPIKTIFIPWSEIAQIQPMNPPKFIKPHSEFNGETRFATEKEEATHELLE